MVVFWEIQENQASSAQKGGWNMSRFHTFLAATFSLALFSPAFLHAKPTIYWYQPHTMAQAKDASARLQFLAPHFVPGNKYGFPAVSSITTTLNKMPESNLGINFFFTVSGVENKPQGLLGLTSISVPYKDDVVTSIVYADIVFFEIWDITYRNDPVQWCVVPFTKNGYQNNILCVPSEDVAHQVADALATLAEAYGTDLQTSSSMAMRLMTEKDLRKHPEQTGCQVEEVDADGPAAQAGIKEGDIVRTVNGATCTKDVVRAAVAEATAKPQGGMVHVEILHKGNPKSLDLNFPHVDFDAAALRQQVAGASREHEAPSIVGATVADSAASAFHLGISGRAVTDSDLAAAGLAKPQGVLITNVEKGSIADQMQMQVGDVILKMNGADVSDATAIAKSVRSGAAKNFRIWRKGKTLDLTIPQSM